MNPNTNQNKVDGPTIEQGMQSMLSDIKNKTVQVVADCESSVRKSPGKAVLIAVAAGYCLNRLPIRGLILSQVKLITALAPPAVVAYGAAKICELLQREARKKA